jgi:hypothetical protein
LDPRHLDAPDVLVAIAWIEVAEHRFTSRIATATDEAIMERLNAFRQAPRVASPVSRTCSSVPVDNKRPRGQGLADGAETRVQVAYARETSRWQELVPGHTTAQN